MNIKIVKNKISKDELASIIKENFGDMAKVDVDIARGILSIGGEWHSEGDELLNADGSSRENVWGINFFPFNSPEKRIEYVSLINIKPTLGHNQMAITDDKLKEKTRAIVEKLLLPSDETLQARPEKME